MDYGVVILAGGKSSRMGAPKAELRLNGVRFLDKLVYELSGFQELLVSVDDAMRHPEIGYPMVSDAVLDCGPMGGLYAALGKCISDALVVVPCDVPLFSKTLADRLCAYLEKGTDAVIAVTEDGKEHPLCGVYKKSCRDTFGKLLAAKNYRMRDALFQLNVKKYQAGKDSWRLRNVNTPQEFQTLTGSSFNFDTLDQQGPSDNESIIRQQTPDCLAVSGWKNSGKTTLIEKLIPLLAKHGFKIATVKHDGHSYTPDVPGTDSYRFFQAGAKASIIYDAGKYSLTRRIALTDGAVLDLAPDADIILLEGFKWSGYPKIEVIRRETGKPPIPDLTGRIAYASDREMSELESVETFRQGLPVFGLQDTQEIAAFILGAYESGALKRRWKD